MFALGIPTLNRYDCLGACVQSALAGTLLPDSIIIIDNGGRLTPAMLPTIPAGVSLAIHPHPRNLGVAGSWNLLHKLALPHAVVITNDDVLFRPGTLQAMAENPGEFVTAIGGCAFACFLCRESTWRAVGDFDEGYKIGYYEDLDFSRRLTAAGVKVSVVPAEHAAEHRHPSSTKHAMGKAERRELERAVARNKRRYEEKWGIVSAVTPPTDPSPHVGPLIHRKRKVAPPPPASAPPPAPPIKRKRYKPHPIPPPFVPNPVVSDGKGF